MEDVTRREALQLGAAAVLAMGLLPSLQAFADEGGGDRRLR